MTSSVWDRFEAMLLEHAPTLIATLLPPATEAQIALAELNLGVQFPEEIRRVYLRQDGSNCPVPSDHVPSRSWAYIQARELMTAVIESLKREERT